MLGPNLNLFDLQILFTKYYSSPCIVLRIGLIVFISVIILAGSGVGIGFGVQKGNAKNETTKEKFNLGLAAKLCFAFYSLKEVFKVSDNFRRK